MGSACRYWTHVRLEASGRLREQEIALVQSFFQQQFPQWANAEELTDLQIQRQLVQLLHSPEQSAIPGIDSGAKRPPITLAQLAEASLRCFVSHQIPVVCFSLEQRFGLHGGFSRHDLCPYVMNDVDPLRSEAPKSEAPKSEAPRSEAPRSEARKPPFQSVAVRIVQTFNPEQSNLSTWTKRLVLQHKELNGALADDYGIYLSSDWAILNHFTQARLRRWLAGSLAADQVQQFCQILDSYHAVYRQARLQQRSTGAGKKCAEPTPEQLQQMVNHLQIHGISDTSPQKLLRELRTLAQRLRQLKQAMAISLDHEKNSFLAEQQQAGEPDDDQEQEQFLTLYRQESEQCLGQAVQQVISQRVAYLDRKQPPKSHLFLKALKLFHCEGKSMTEIAPLVGLQKQFQVSRLLELKALRSDLRQQWLKQMQQQLPQLLKDLSSPAQLESLDQQLDQRLSEALTELIDRMIDEDTTDSYSPKRNSRSLFTVSLASILETWRMNHDSLCL
jgi:hypothetical protein